MSKSQKAGNTRNQKKTKNMRGAGLILLALLIVLAGAAYFVFQEPGPASPSAGSTPAAQNDADFNSRCDALHVVVERVLDNQNLIVSDVRLESKEAARQKKDGKIRWNAKNTLIENAGANTVDTLRRSLDSALKSSGGAVLKVEPDQYHGFSVTRIDIGIQEQLGGGPLTIISDRLYIAETVRRTAATGVRQKTDAAHKGEIALIIDDFGYRQDMIAEFSAIRRSFTFAVIPLKPYSKDAAAKGLASGHQVMLHLPFEPLSGIEQSEITSTVRVGMSTEQIRELLDRSTSGLPGLIGINNHQGSKATADRQTMEKFMKELQLKGLFFVDSRTNGRSVGAETARHAKVKTTENDLFIDGMADAAYIKKQLRTAGEMAARMGSVTVIGHARPATAAALREMIPEMEAKGIRFVFVSQLVR